MIKDYFKRNSPIFYIGIITAVVFVFIIIAGQSVPSPTIPMEVLSDTALYGPENPIIGSSDAKVTIVEFSDYNCPACAQIAPALKQLVSQNEDKVKLVVRHLPLPIPGHETSRDASLASTASNVFGKFNDYHNKVFSLPKKDRESLIELATSLGINKEEFIKAMDSEEVKNIVDGDILASENLRLQSTPSIFINGKRVTDLNKLGQLIEEEVSKHYTEAN